MLRLKLNGSVVRCKTTTTTTTTTRTTTTATRTTTTTVQLDKSMVGCEVYAGGGG